MKIVPVSPRQRGPKTPARDAVGVVATRRLAAATAGHEPPSLENPHDARARPRSPSR